MTIMTALKENSNAAKMILIIGFVSYLCGFTLILLLISGVPYILVHKKSGVSVVFNMYVLPTLSTLYVNIVHYIEKNWNNKERNQRFLNIFKPPLTLQ